MKKIIAVTGSRSEYAYLYPILKAIRKRGELDLGLVVTGAHLTRKYGYTIKDIEKDGFRIVCKIKSLCLGDKDVFRIKSLAIQLFKLVAYLSRNKPDMLLVVGDREEAMSVALAGQYMNIAVAHVGGGDRVMHNVDDQVRHAVSKMAHIHFVTNKESAERLAKMGEQDFRIFDIGSPSLDRILATPQISKIDLFKYFGFDNKNAGDHLILVIQHSLSTEIDSAYRQMKETLEAVKELRLNTVISYPNSDPGSQAVIQCIEEYKNLPFVRIFRNIPDIQFVNVLRHASCLLGNSSAGILESPFLRLPVVNIGKRQEKRLHSDNVQFVGHDRQAIRRAVERAVFDVDYIKNVGKCINPYGDGHSGDRIADVLANIQLDKKLLVKDITY